MFVTAVNRKSVIEHFVMISQRDLDLFPEKEYFSLHRNGVFEIDALSPGASGKILKLNQENMVSLMEAIDDNFPGLFWQDNSIREKFYDSIEYSYFTIRGGIIECIP